MKKARRLSLLFLCPIAYLWHSTIPNTVSAKHIFISILILVSALHLRANEDQEFYFGGGIGASFGNVTSVMVNPLVGYYVFPKTAIGVSATYQYYKDNQYELSTSIYGGSVFAEQFVTDQIFLRGEYELLSLETAYFDKLGLYPNDKRFLHHGVLAGGGYRQQISSGGSFFILGMVNLNQSENSPYGMPIIKIGFTFQ